jgi:hypothetical protein
VARAAAARGLSPRAAAAAAPALACSDATVAAATRACLAAAIAEGGRLIDAGAGWPRIDGGPMQDAAGFDMPYQQVTKAALSP